MKKLFIEAKSDFNIDTALKHIKLTGKIGLVTTIQYLHKLKGLSKKLDSIIGGQILGSLTGKKSCFG